MRSAARVWGHSLAVRIPKGLAEKAGLGAGTPVDLELEDGRIVVTPVRPKLTLDELVARITPENLHAEVVTGPAVGNEVW